jgi:hypothetical protein
MNTPGASNIPSLGGLSRAANAGESYGDEREPEIDRSLSYRTLPASSRALQQIAASKGRIY